MAPAGRVTSTVTKLTIQLLEEGITYKFSVNAMNSAGSSAAITYRETFSTGKHTIV